MDRVTALKTASSAPAHGAEGAVRPKVMRRPAHFSDAAPSTSVQSINLPDVVSRDKPVAQSKSWQDDGRFAVALLAIIILTNLAVMAWLSHIGHRPTHVPASVVATAPLVSTPDPLARGVTVFAQPETDATPRLTHLELTGTPASEDDSAAPAIHVLDADTTKASDQ